VAATIVSNLGHLGAQLRLAAYVLYFNVSSSGGGSFRSLTVAFASFCRAAIAFLYFVFFALSS
jgi:hypothetical protein